MLQAEGVEALRASEVHNLDGVEVGHHDVVGLEVQVEDAPVVEVLDPLEDLDQVARDVVLGVTEPLVSRKKKKEGSEMSDRPCPLCEPAQSTPTLPTCL